MPGEVAHNAELRARDDLAEVEYERRAEGLPAQRAAAIAVEMSEIRQSEEGGAARTAEQAITSGDS
jgi:hypothetical protein